MNRYIPWAEIYVFGGLSLLSIIAVLISVFTTQEWTWITITLLIGIPGSVIGLSIFVILRKWLSRPDYITKQNVSVWTTKNNDPSKKHMEEILDYFHRKFANLIPGISIFKQLVNMSDGAQIHWEDEPISIISQQGWTIKNVAFVQKGKQIRVLKGSVDNFFHALGHMYIEIVLGLLPDYKYEHKIWDTIDLLIAVWGTKND
jgi:hypothetical protein